MVPNMIRFLSCDYKEHFSAEDIDRLLSEFTTVPRVQEVDLCGDSIVWAFSDTELNKQEIEHAYRQWAVGE